MREQLIKAAELEGGLKESELEAFDRRAREVFRDALADAPDGEAFMRYYREHAAEISDIGKEERAIETQQ